MFTASPELLPAGQLFHITSHLGHLPPKPGLFAQDGRRPERHNGALTVLTRNKRAQRNCISAAGHGGIV
jgi:hypothetical protein